MIVVIEKNIKHEYSYSIQVKPHILVVEFSKKSSFLRNARFDVILTNVIYNNQTRFSLQIVLLQVTCWLRNIKTPK